MSPRTAGRVRDAARSRQAILDVAEELFAERGYDGVSLHEIAGEAGLSRGTPSYFFGSKEQLYIEVLDRAFTVRQAATVEAFAPVHDWCQDPDRGLDELRGALAGAADAYLRFLVRRPQFARLVMQEELGGGRRMAARSAPSTAMQDAFGTLRAQGPRRGLGEFRVEEAVLVFIGLAFAPASYRETLMRAMRRDLSRTAMRRAQVQLVVDQLMHLLTAPHARQAYSLAERSTS